MKNIENIIERFASELRGRLGEKILGIYLFGSIAKGTGTDESDIDLVVYEESGEIYTVVTAYITSQITRYWKEET